ncbi:hypothetical protein J6590_012093 [Homalodisca vitripennis]|nr:hypothetical protein J6590_012093 [Homalodisca vitripennis]
MYILVHPSRPSMYKSVCGRPADAELARVVTSRRTEHCRKEPRECSGGNVESSI